VKTRHYLFLFYSFILITLIIDGMPYLNLIQLEKPIWLLLLFNQPVMSDFLKLTIYLLTLTTTLVLTINTNFLLRVVHCTLFLLFYSILYSKGKINHSSHAWIWSACLLVFIEQNKPLSYGRNFFVLRLIQSIILSHYFISGSWKLTSIGNFLTPSLAEQTILEHIYHTIAEGNGPSTIIKNLLLKIDPIYLGLCFYLVIIFQFSCIIPIIRQCYFRYWGYMAILFHVSTGLFLGIWFLNTISALLFFLIFTEDILSNTASSN
jgi:hypothetical protein